MRPFICAASLAAIVACGDSNRAQPSNSSATRDSSASPTTVAADTGRWIVTEYGIGAIKAGMTLAEANSAIAAKQSSMTADTTECEYAAWKNGPPGVGVMVASGFVARIDINDSAVTTATGAKIGDSEDHIRALYGARVTSQPHKYDDRGHYLIVAPLAAKDSAFRIVFETDGQKVKTYRVGRRPEVEYIEGCS